jgi:predicted glycoside hydrolase/deacetylase ChbG (UPF0249 family)
VRIPPDDTTASRAIVICADDYGQGPAISTGIRDLAARGVLSAVSCLTLCPAWEAEGRALMPLADRIDIGLHLCLTQFAPLGPVAGLSPDGGAACKGGVGLAAVIAAALAGRLDQASVAAEFTRQLDRFVAVTGRLPDFLDGHQHVHILPVVRRAVVDLTRRWPPGSPRPYLRSLSRLGPALGAVLGSGPGPVGEMAKAGVLAALSAGSDRVFAAAGLPLTGGFRGLHGFDGGETADRALGRFRRWVTAPVPRLLVACHPGLPGPAGDGPDPIAPSRSLEYRVMADPAFALMLAEAGVRPARFAATKG